MKLFLYKIQMKQDLLEAEKAKRAHFCEIFLGVSPAASLCIRFIDETQLHLNGNVNTWNINVWATNLLHNIMETLLLSEKCRM